jgi:hypothetical protein
MIINCISPKSGFWITLTMIKKIKNAVIYQGQAVCNPHLLRFPLSPTWQDSKVQLTIYIMFITTTFTHNYYNWDSSAGIVTRVQPGQLKRHNSISGKSRIFSLLRDVHNRPGANPTSYRGCCGY